MQQIYRGTPTPKSDLNRVALQLCNFIEIALRHRRSPANLFYIFRKPFPKNTSGWLRLTHRDKAINFLLVKVLKLNIKRLSGRDNTHINTQAVAQMCSVKKISQNSQENTFTRVSFMIKLQISTVKYFGKTLQLIDI